MSNMQPILTVALLCVILYTSPAMSVVMCGVDVPYWDPNWFDVGTGDSCSMLGVKSPVMHSKPSWLSSIKYFFVQENIPKGATLAFWMEEEKVTLVSYISGIFTSAKEKINSFSYASSWFDRTTQNNIFDSWFGRKEIGTVNSIIDGLKNEKTKYLQVISSSKELLFAGLIFPNEIDNFASYSLLLNQKCRRKIPTAKIKWWNISLMTLCTVILIYLNFFLN